MTGVAVGVVVDIRTGAEVTGAVAGDSVSALMGVLVATCIGFDVGERAGANVGPPIGACVAAASHVAGGSEDKLQMPSLIHLCRRMGRKVVSQMRVVGKPSGEPMKSATYFIPRRPSKNTRNVRSSTSVAEALTSRRGRGIKQGHRH
jgi:hypothetical protein